MAVKLDRWESADERSRDEVFAELYEASYPSLVKYCRGLLNGSADPEEVAQEAFLRAWMTWDRYATSRPFWALVATIARNLCMDHHRHERVVATVLEQRAGELTASAPAVTPEERLEQDEEYEWARQAMAELCPNHQRVLNLREIEGWSADDMAAADGTSPEAATAALYRARQRLRDAYNRVAAGALAGVALVPLRSMRRRFGMWAHHTGQAAAASPALVSRAGEAVATVVAVAVVTGAPVVNPLPQAAAPDRPAPVVAEQRATGRQGVIAPVNSTPASAAAKGPAAAAKGATVPGAAKAVASPVVAGTPDDVTVTQFTTAPAGSSSRDIYATGVSLQGCTSAPCPVLFHSADGGATWDRLKATGFSGGTVMLPPTFPKDGRVFASGPSGLQVSADNGASFSTLVPLSGPTAVSPALPIDHRILIGAVPGWEYRDDSNTTTPLHLDGRPQGHTLSFAFSPAYAKDGKLFVSTSTPSRDDPTHQASTVTVCESGKCGDAAVLADADRPATVQPSRLFASNGVVYAWAGEHLYRSTDGADSFKSLTLPAKAGVQTVAEDPDGAVYVSLLTVDPKTGSTGGVYVTRDGGKTWTQVGKDTALAKGASSVVSLGHDRLLAAPNASGLLCSADAGKTWAKRCPATP